MAETAQFGTSTPMPFTMPFTHAVRIFFFFFLKLDQFLKFIWKNKHVWLARKTLQNSKYLQDYFLKCIIKAIIIKIVRHQLSNRVELNTSPRNHGDRVHAKPKTAEISYMEYFKSVTTYNFFITGYQAKKKIICIPVLRF